MIPLRYYTVDRSQSAPFTVQEKLVPSALLRLNYSPHSLRHGGATRHFLQKKPISDIQFRGRWSSSKSVRTYIQSGRALLLLTQVPTEVFQVASDCSQVIKPLLAFLKQRPSSSYSASAVTLRAGRRTSSDRKVQDGQAS